MNEDQNMDEITPFFEDEMEMIIYLVDDKLQSFRVGDLKGLPDEDISAIATLGSLRAKLGTLRRGN